MTTPALPDLTCRCQHCGSPRVAGVYLRSLNQWPGPDGKLRPMVSDKAIAAVRSEVADPKRYFYRCFECFRFGNRLVNVEMIHEEHADLVS